MSHLLVRCSHSLATLTTASGIGVRASACKDLSSLLLSSPLPRLLSLRQQHAHHGLSPTLAGESDDGGDVPWEELPTWDDVFGGLCHHVEAVVLASAKSAPTAKGAINALITALRLARVAPGVARVSVRGDASAGGLDGSGGTLGAGLPSFTPPSPPVSASALHASSTFKAAHHIGQGAYVQQRATSHMATTEEDFDIDIDHDPGSLIFSSPESSAESSVSAANARLCCSAATLQSLCIVATRIFRCETVSLLECATIWELLFGNACDLSKISPVIIGDLLSSALLAILPKADVTHVRRLGRLQLATLFFDVVKRISKHPSIMWAADWGQPLFHVSPLVAQVAEWCGGHLGLVTVLTEDADCFCSVLWSIAILLRQRGADSHALVCAEPVHVICQFVCKRSRWSSLTGRSRRNKDACFEFLACLVEVSSLAYSRLHEPLDAQVPPCTQLKGIRLPESLHTANDFPPCLFPGYAPDIWLVPLVKELGPTLLQQDTLRSHLQRRNQGDASDSALVGHAGSSGPFPLVLSTILYFQHALSSKHVPEAKAWVDSFAGCLTLHQIFRKLVNKDGESMSLPASVAFDVDILAWVISLYPDTLKRGILLARLMEFVASLLTAPTVELEPCQSAARLVNSILESFNARGSPTIEATVGRGALLNDLEAGCGVVWEDEIELQKAIADAIKPISVDDLSDADSTFASRHRAAWAHVPTISEPLLTHSATADPAGKEVLGAIQASHDMLRVSGTLTYVRQLESGAWCKLLRCAVDAAARASAVECCAVLLSIAHQVASRFHLRIVEEKQPVIAELGPAQEVWAFMLPSCWLRTHTNTIEVDLRTASSLSNAVARMRDAPTLGPAFEQSVFVHKLAGHAQLAALLLVMRHGSCSVGGLSTVLHDYHGLVVQHRLFHLSARHLQMLSQAAVSVRNELGGETSAECVAARSCLGSMCRVIPSAALDDCSADSPLGEKEGPQMSPLIHELLSTVTSTLGISLEIDRPSSYVHALRRICDPTVALVPPDKLLLFSHVIHICVASCAHTRVQPKHIATQLAVVYCLVAHVLHSIMLQDVDEAIILASIDALTCTPFRHIQFCNRYSPFLAHAALLCWMQLGSCVGDCRESLRQLAAKGLNDATSLPEPTSAKTGQKRGRKLADLSSPTPHSRRRVEAVNRGVLHTPLIRCYLALCPFIECFTANQGDGSQWEYLGEINADMLGHKHSTALHWLCQIVCDAPWGSDVLWPDLADAAQHAVHASIFRAFLANCIANVDQPTGKCGLLDIDDIVERAFSEKALFAVYEDVGQPLAILMQTFLHRIESDAWQAGRIMYALTSIINHLHTFDWCDFAQVLCVAATGRARLEPHELLVPFAERLAEIKSALVSKVLSVAVDVRGPAVFDDEGQGSALTILECALLLMYAAPLAEAESHVTSIKLLELVLTVVPGDMLELAEGRVNAVCPSLARKFSDFGPLPGSYISNGHFQNLNMGPEVYQYIILTGLYSPSQTVRQAAAAIAPKFMVAYDAACWFAPSWHLEQEEISGEPWQWHGLPMAPPTSDSLIQAIIPTIGTAKKAGSPKSLSVSQARMLTHAAGYTDRILHFENPLNNINDDGCMAGILLDSLHCLAHIAVSAAPEASEALCELLRRNSSCYPWVHYVGRCLRRASLVNQGGISALLHARLPGVLAAWLNRGLPVESFPWDMYTRLSTSMAATYKLVAGASYGVFMHQSSQVAYAVGHASEAARARLKGSFAVRQSSTASPHLQAVAMRLQAQPTPAQLTAILSNGRGLSPDVEEAVRPSSFDFELLQRAVSLICPGSDDQQLLTDLVLSSLVKWVCVRSCTGSPDDGDEQSRVLLAAFVARQYLQEPAVGAPIGLGMKVHGTPASLQDKLRSSLMGKSTFLLSLLSCVPVSGTEMNLHHSISALAVAVGMPAEGIFDWLIASVPGHLTIDETTDMHAIGQLLNVIANAFAATSSTTASCLGRQAALRRDGAKRAFTIVTSAIVKSVIRCQRCATSLAPVVVDWLNMVVVITEEIARMLDSGVSDSTQVLADDGPQCLLVAWIEACRVMEPFSLGMVMLAQKCYAEHAWSGGDAVVAALKSWLQATAKFAQKVSVTERLSSVGITAQAIVFDVYFSIQAQLSVLDSDTFSSAHLQSRLYPVLNDCLRDLDGMTVHPSHVKTSAVGKCALVVCCMQQLIRASQGTLEWLGHDSSDHLGSHSILLRLHALRLAILGKYTCNIRVPATGPLVVSLKLLRLILGRLSANCGSVGQSAATCAELVEVAYPEDWPSIAVTVHNNAAESACEPCHPLFGHFQEPADESSLDTMPGVDHALRCINQFICQTPACFTPIAHSTLRSKSDDMVANVTSVSRGVAELAHMTPETWDLQRIRAVHIASLKAHAGCYNQEAPFWEYMTTSACLLSSTHCATLVAGACLQPSPTFVSAFLGCCATDVPPLSSADYCMTIALSKVAEMLEWSNEPKDRIAASSGVRWVETVLSAEKGSRLLQFLPSRLADTLMLHRENFNACPLGAAATASLPVTVRNTEIARTPPQQTFLRLMLTAPTQCQQRDLLPSALVALANCYNIDPLLGGLAAAVVNLGAVCAFVLPAFIAHAIVTSALHVATPQLRPTIHLESGWASGLEGMSRIFDVTKPTGSGPDRWELPAGGEGVSMVTASSSRMPISGLQYRLGVALSWSVQYGTEWCKKFGVHAKVQQTLQRFRHHLHWVGRYRDQLKDELALGAPLPPHVQLDSMAEAATLHRTDYLSEATNAPLIVMGNDMLLMDHPPSCRSGLAWRKLRDGFTLLQDSDSLQGCDSKLSSAAIDAVFPLPVDLMSWPRQLTDNVPSTLLPPPATAVTLSPALEYAVVLQTTLPKFPTFDPTDTVSQSECESMLACRAFSPNLSECTRIRRAIPYLERNNLINQPAAALCSSNMLVIPLGTACGTGSSRADLVSRLLSSARSIACSRTATTHLRILAWALSEQRLAAVDGDMHYSDTSRAAFLWSRLRLLLYSTLSALMTLQKLLKTRSESFTEMTWYAITLAHTLEDTVGLLVDISRENDMHSLTNTSVRTSAPFGKPSPDGSLEVFPNFHSRNSSPFTFHQVPSSVRGLEVVTNSLRLVAVVFFGDEFGTRDDVNVPDAMFVDKWVLLNRKADPTQMRALGVLVLDAAKAICDAKEVVKRVSATAEHPSLMSHVYQALEWSAVNYHMQAFTQIDRLYSETTSSLSSPAHLAVLAVMEERRGLLAHLEGQMAAFTRLYQQGRSKEATSLLNGGTERGLRRYISDVRAQVELDRLQINNLKRANSTMLELLLRAIRRLLVGVPAQCLSTYGTRISFRLFALATDLGKSDDDSALREILKMLLRVPMAPFVTLLPQVASHLGSLGDYEIAWCRKAFFVGVNDVDARVHVSLPLVAEMMMYRLLLQAPSRSIYQLCGKEKLGTMGQSDGKFVDTDKIAAAHRVLENAKGFHGVLAVTVDAVRAFTDAMVSLAMFRIDKTFRSKLTELSAVPLLTPTTSPHATKKISKELLTVADLNADSFRDRLRFCALPTAAELYQEAPFPATTTASWASPVTVASVGEMSKAGLPSFSVAASGLSLPKVLTVLGSNGRQYRMLIKWGEQAGVDDLRQDAVLQQLFYVANMVLRSQPSTRHLQVRRYAVVPLSPTTGIVEWVHGCLPMGSYLTERPWEAHHRYKPTELKVPEARHRLEKGHLAFKEGKLMPDGSDPRIHAMSEVLAATSPTFHRFFEDFFSTAEAWLVARRRYTMSVAANTIVGYIAGIGDRHIHNILLDTSSAEVVHIDFGIAFEQGRLLPVPEMVPARLTRDVVDGFGALGIQGPFTLQCERMLDALQKSRLTLITLVSVLLHDPLYRWNLTSERVLRLQTDRAALDESTTSTSAMARIVTPSDAYGPDAKVAETNAARAISRVTDKLDGIDYSSTGGAGPQHSAHVQVAKLLQDCMDVSKWAVMFPGWQPYL